MKLVQKKITIDELKKMSKSRFGNLVKAVVDVEKEIIAIDAELHADEEAYLLERGSKQKDLWGINLYPDKKGNDFIEFDSMINVRPSVDNLSRFVEDRDIRKLIVKIVGNLVER